MLVSHSHHFIFVHNYKVAGSSVRIALEPYIERTFADRIRKNVERVERGIKQRILRIPAKPTNLAEGVTAHLKAREIKSHLPSVVFDTYFKFGFVRNPWDWQVSQYEYVLRTKTHHVHKQLRAMKDFKAFIQWRVREDVRLQKDFFYDKDGNCLVDFIGRFENLSQDFDTVCDKIGVPQPNLPHKLNGKKKGFITYYDQETIDLIYDAFRPDIDTFGYHKPELSVASPH